MDYLITKPEVKREVKDKVLSVIIGGVGETNWLHSTQLTHIQLSL